MSEVADEVIDATEVVTPLPAPVLSFSTEVSNTLSVFDRAREKLSEIVGEALYDVSNEDQMALAKQHAELMRSARDAAEEAYKTWNAPYLAARTENIKARDAFIEFTTSLQTKITDQIHAETRRKKAERDARNKAEQERVAAHHEAIAQLIALGNMAAATTEQVREQLERVNADGFLATRDWQEFNDRANEEHARVISTLNQHLENAQARERLAALEAEQAEAEARRQEQDRQAEAERNRVATLERAISDIALFPRASTGMDTAFIAGQVKVLEAMGTGEDKFAEFSERATSTKADALRDLRDMHEAAATAEANTRRIAEQQAEQQRMLDAMAAIQAIQALTTQADGKDAKAIGDLLKQAEATVITEAKFGTMAAVAQTTKDAAIVSLNVRLSAAQAAAEEAEREAERRKAEAQAEAARAEAARQAAERVKENADLLLVKLREVIALARGAGLSAEVLDEADTLINKLSTKE